MTVNQADRLAVSRFLLYQGGGSRVRAVLPSAQGSLSLVADVDLRTHVGYGRITGAGSSFVLEWDGATFLAWPTSVTSAVAPAVLPRATPATRALAPRTVTSDALLALLLQFGSDRPDNAQLLRQGGATWLRSTTIETTTVDVIAGPHAAQTTSGGSEVQYYIDARGNLLRVVARLGGIGSSPTTIDFAPHQFRPVPVSPLLTH